ncbi:MULTISPECIES: gp53-like domain-containing protein [Burkholderia cepacia complex]|uniref:gp53-like domain-containing protein n=1 Tax=Burkholderia cepacia complex TaxID=87882 RepID=UPI000BA55FD2|nr:MULTISPECIES: hypothetical protein [Burkholderia cepacia complex]PAK14006.1 hypothetical protein CJO66_13690 [Burkholderia ubonensis]RQQ00136.1 hypothetical protein DF009_01820 [Burkholderia ubonensis]RQQ49119.1 hypothetical protein DF145_16015 [Burkholderia stagnalis]RQY00070.1 hypothetical protein DF121_16455 [Burkholderia stagnalis]RQY14498.1 hypothetical protein DF115_19110 [Burkholderia stagnalis]
MAKLVESSQWEEDLYQIETSDPVEGGPDGVSNRQAKLLGGRTRFLKLQVERSQDGLAGHVGAGDPHPQYATKDDLAARLADLVGQSPETLNTLNELAKALGNDPNFATTTTNALASKAPIDSPVFTGTPKAPTPPQFDNSTKQATTAFVQRALGNFNLSSGTGSGIAAAATAFTNADLGGFHYFNGATTQTATLPNEVGLQPGAAITIQRGAQYALTIGTYSGTAIIDATVGLASSITINSGEFVVLVWSGTYWQLFGTYAQRVGQPFASSLAGVGYQKLPSGLIIQWGYTAISSASGPVYTAFPITFPNAVYGVTLGTGATGQGIVTAIENTNLASGFSYGAWLNSAGRVSGISSFFIAIGK